MATKTVSGWWAMAVVTEAEKNKRRRAIAAERHRGTMDSPRCEGLHDWYGRQCHGKNQLEEGKKYVFCSLKYVITFRNWGSAIDGF